LEYKKGGKEMRNGLILGLLILLTFGSLYLFIDSISGEVINNPTNLISVNEGKIAIDLNEYRGLGDNDLIFVSLVSGKEVVFADDMKFREFRSRFNSNNGIYAMELSNLSNTKFIDDKKYIFSFEAPSLNLSEKEEFIY
jgi:hypothetical protein